MINDHDNLDLLLDLALLQRQAEANVRRGQHGQAFVDVARDMARPLLADGVIPDGMPSLIRRAPVERISIRRKK
jgi:hypothetical protein